MSSILDFHPNPPAHLGHLSDDELDDQLMGDFAAASAAHLASCDLCADRLAEASAHITSFQTVTAAWSERRSATLPLPNLSRRKALWQRNGAWVAATFVLAIGIGFSGFTHHVAPKIADVRPLQVQSSAQNALPASGLSENASVTKTPPAEQISADNQMLQAVDSELDASTDSPAALGIEPASDPSNWPASTTSVQD